MTLGEWMKKYRAEHGLSMQAAADLFGFSKAYIGMLENGINPTTKKPLSPKLDTFEKVAKGVGMDIDMFLKNLDETQQITLNKSTSPAPNIPGAFPVPGGHRIPVLGRVVAGIPIEAVEDIIGYIEIDEKMAKNGTYYGLQVKGGSMEPTLHEGDVIVVRKQERIESGEIAIVLVNGDEATVKEVKESESGLTLIGHNVAVYSPHFYSWQEVESLPIQVIGKVVELRRRL